jgi:hypothetical protein
MHSTTSDIHIFLITTLLALIAAPGVAALSFLVWGI